MRIGPLGQRHEQSVADDHEGGAVDLSWSAASDENVPLTYNIYYATSSTGQNFSIPDNTTTSTSYQVIGLNNDQEYFFVVRAEDSLGNEEKNTDELSATPSGGPGCIPTGAVGYWKFDKGSASTVYDMTSNDNDGTIINSDWTTGRSGSAISFDDEDGYVEIEDSISLKISGDIALEGWFNTAVDTGIYSGDYGLIGKWGYPSTTQNYLLWSNDKHIIFDSASAENSVVWSNGLTTLADGNWHHLVFTRIGTTGKIYFDGVEKASDEVSTISSSDIPFQIGTYSSRAESPNVSVFPGWIDEVAVYDQSLSSTEVYNRFNANVANWKFEETNGTILNDETAYSNDGTLINSIIDSILVSGRSGYGLDFGEVYSSYVKVPDSSSLRITGDITLEGWFKTSVDTGIYSGDYGLIGKLGYPSTTQNYLLWSNDKHIIFDSAGTTNSLVWSNGLTTLANGNWHHLVFTRIGSTGTIYFDGAVEATGTVSNITTSDTPFHIGTYDARDISVFPGKIDEVSVYDRALTDSEVYTRFSTGP